MKKKLSFILFLVIAFTMVSCQNAFAGVSSTWEDSEIRNIYISDGVSFEGTFNAGKEMKTILPTGETQYTKKANIKGEFRKAPGNEIILGGDLEVTFKYNNVDVWVENPQTDILKNNYEVSGPKWKVTSNEEVYVSPGQCIVSEQTSLYKKAGWFNIRKSWNSVGNFHTDIVCSANGEIKFNSESLGKSANGEFVLKNVFSGEKCLQDDITRKTNIVDEICPLNQVCQTNSDKDKYNYITRQIESSYFDSANNLIASVIMQVNFRYNTKTKEVECISTSHKENVTSGKNAIDVYLRTGDKTRNHGGAYGKIKVDYNTQGKSGDIEESLVVNCDYNGNITINITEN